MGLSLLLVGLGAGGSLGGCGGDDKAPATVPEDGEDAAVTGDSGGEVTPETVTIDVVVAAATVYAGQSAQIVASQSKASNGAPLTFGWSFASVPSGSAVGNASIQGVNELVSFVPDVAGEYVLSITATTGEVTAKKDITVRAVNAPVFFVRTVSGATSRESGYEMRTVQMDGTEERAIACRQVTLTHLPEAVSDAGAIDDLFDAEASDSGEGFQLGLMNFMYLSLFADQALDWWEAPAGELSRAAFQDISPLPDGGPDAATMRVSLFIANPENSCQTPPFSARVFDGKGGDALWQPKFSPDGRRVAYVEVIDNKASLVTTSLDGTDQRYLGPVCEDETTGCFNENLFPRRPQWLDETHVGWLRTTTEQESSIGWEVVVAPDIPSAPISRYMTCASGKAPLLFNFLRDGSLLIGASTVKDGPEDLFVMSRSSTGACVMERKLTDLLQPGSYARDFAISPDGTMVAYVQKIGDPTQDAGSLDIQGSGELWMVPLDGTQPPAPVGGVPRAAVYGPRWIAGGTRLSWNGLAPPPLGYEAGIPNEVEDGGVPLEDAGASVDQLLEAGLPAINVIQPDGGGFKAVALGDPLNGSYVLGGGNGGACSLQCTGLGCGEVPACGDGQAVTCAVASERERKNGPMFWAWLFGGIFLLRRRGRAS